MSALRSRNGLFFSVPSQFGEGQRVPVRLAAE